MHSAGQQQPGCARGAACGSGAPPHGSLGQWHGCRRAPSRCSPSLGGRTSCCECHSHKLQACLWQDKALNCMMQYPHPCMISKSTSAASLLSTIWESEACKDCRKHAWFDRTAPEDWHCAAVAAATELPAEVDRPQAEHEARLRGASTDGFPSVTPAGSGADSMSSACCLKTTGRLSRALQEYGPHQRCLTPYMHCIECAQSDDQQMIFHSCRASELVRTRD